MTHRCDICDGGYYTHDNPFVNYRVPRPSDPTDMCCTMWGHLKCLGGKISMTPQGGVATPDQWQDWIENEGAKLGFCFLS